jgi:hypothetical protein
VNQPSITAERSRIYATHATQTEHTVEGALHNTPHQFHHPSFETNKHANGDSTGCECVALRHSWQQQRRSWRSWFIWLASFTAAKGFCSVVTASTPSDASGGNTCCCGRRERHNRSGRNRISNVDCERPTARKRWINSSIHGRSIARTESADGRLFGNCLG